LSSATSGAGSDRAITEGIEKAKADQRLLTNWQNCPFNFANFEAWINDTVTRSWGRRQLAACITSASQVKTYNFLIHLNPVQRPRNESLK